MSIQNKIVLGIASFVGIMLLGGWLAINEPARMEVFTRQWDGRSIERGAELYLNNCTSCHAVDSLGLAGYAPALKNPMLFRDSNPGKVANDRFKDLQRQRNDLQALVDAYNNDVQQRPMVEARRNAAAEGSEERKAAQAELDDIDARIRAYDPATEQKLADLDVKIMEAQAEVEKYKAEGWEVTRDVRLKELNWAGGLRDYLRSTLISGRPTSGGLWGGNIMPAWGQAAGGPLRNDEIENLVDYLMNYASEAVKLTPNDVRQQFKIAGEGAAAVDKITLGRSVDVMTLDLSGGDPAAGKTKYEGVYGCAACHGAPGGAAWEVAPLPGTYTRVVDVRLKVAQFAGYTPEQYLAESIIYPARYVVAGSAVQMPANFGDLMDLQDLKDVIAYLATYK